MKAHEVNLPPTPQETRPLLVKNNTRNLPLKLHSRHHLPHLTRPDIPPHNNHPPIRLQPNGHQIPRRVEGELPGPHAPRGGVLDEGELAGGADGEGDDGVGGEGGAWVRGVGDLVGRFAAGGDG